MAVAEVVRIGRSGLLSLALEFNGADLKFPARNRAHGAVGHDKSRSIQWAEKQEKFQ